jgi:hypothetical protein
MTPGRLEGLVLRGWGAAFRGDETFFVEGKCKTSSGLRSFGDILRLFGVPGGLWDPDKLLGFLSSFGSLVSPRELKDLGRPTARFFSHLPALPFFHIAKTCTDHGVPAFLVRSPARFPNSCSECDVWAGLAANIQALTVQCQCRKQMHHQFPPACSDMVRAAFSLYGVSHADGVLQMARHVSGDIASDLLLRLGDGV